MTQSFSDAEMTRRLESLRDLMDTIGVEAVVLTSFHNTLYYSNFWMTPFGRYHAAVIPRRGAPALIGPLIEYDRPEKYSWFDDVRIYKDAASPFDGILASVTAILADNGIAHGRIGIEEDYIPVTLAKDLQRALPKCEFVDVSHGMMRIQLVKSEEEIALIRQGAEVTSVGAEAFCAAIAEGVTEVEVARAAVNAMEADICRRFPDFEMDATWSWCQSGVERTYVAHAPNTMRRIEKGDILSLNCFPMIVGYYHLLERSMVFGAIEEPIRTPFEVTSAAHEAGIAAVKPGVRCCDIDDFVNPIFEEAGLLEHRTFGTGHSFGIMGTWYGRDELGEMRPYNDTVIQENMVVSIEPMISVPGVGGFRHADMLLVTADGNEVLTKFQRGLISV